MYKLNSEEVCSRILTMFELSMSVDTWISYIANAGLTHYRCNCDDIEMPIVCGTWDT